MEYQSLWAGSIGLLTTFFWLLDYLGITRVAQLRVTSEIEKGSKIKSIRFFNLLVGLTAWLLVSYSLTGPRKPLKFIPGEIEVNDIYLVLDISKSMDAIDLQPNRLEVAKAKLREFAALRPTDRVGVIIFSEKVFTLLPLTTDPSLVDKMIADVQTGLLGSGTNIGDALALAVARAQASKTKNKVIVLLTDGVNNVGNMTPIQAARLAKQYGIKVYTIGLGSKKDAKMPTGNSMFGPRFQVIPGGSIDLKTLKEISDMTGGKTYRAESEGSLKNILDEIQELEKTKIKSSGQVIYEELYWQYLLIGVLLLVLHEFVRKIWIREVV